MSDVGSLLGLPREVKTFQEDERWVLPKSNIGVEIEYEGVPGGMDGASKIISSDPILGTNWVAHIDNSLKENGVEFTFRTPLFGKDAYVALERMMEVAKEKKFKCTLRTGIHVHHDARDMETSQLVGQTILYAILEPILFRFIGENRENSIFCIPFYKADESLLESCELINAALLDEKENLGRVGQVAKKIARYAAYNLNALHKFGTVEWRHMKTTHNHQRVVDWINIIMSLKAASFRLPTSDGAILQLAKTTPTNAFLEYVFGTALAKKLWVPDAKYLINEVGIPSAQDLVLYGLTNNDWDDVAIPDGKHEGFHLYMKTPRPGAATKAPKKTIPPKQKKPWLATFEAPYVPYQFQNQPQQAQMQQAGLQVQFIPPSDFPPEPPPDVGNLMQGLENEMAQHQVPVPNIPGFFNDYENWEAARILEGWKRHSTMFDLSEDWNGEDNWFEDPNGRIWTREMT